MNLLRNGLPKPPPPKTRPGHIWFRDAAGQSHPSALFTDIEIGYIREALAAGCTQRRLARIWNVSQSAIHKIGNNSRYRTT